MSVQPVLDGGYSSVLDKTFPKLAISNLVWIAAAIICDLIENFQSGCISVNKRVDISEGLEIPYDDKDQPYDCSIL